LIQRKDDTEEVLKKRLNTYHSQTTPVLEYYKKFGLVHTIDATQKQPAVYEDIMSQFK